MAESDQVLDLIKKYESQGKNIQNYRFDPTHTAQGFYQITNTNWNAYAPEAGVDLKKYPNAMAAPEDVQRKVAQHLLEKTPKGLQNWEVHPKVMAELQGTKPTPTPVVKVPETQAKGGEFTLEELQAELARRESARGPIEKWAVSPPEKMAWANPLGLTEAAKKIVRGFGGFRPPERQGEYGLMGQAADVGEGVLDIGKPLALGAAAMSVPWALANPGAAALGLVGGAGGAYYGRDFGGRLAGLFTDKDPDAIRLGQEGGEVAGGYLGGKFSGEIPGLLTKKLGPGLLRKFSGILGGFGGGGSASPPPAETPPKPPPGAKVEKPTTFPATKEADEAIRLGTMTDEQYIAHMKSLGLDENAQRIKLNTAKARADEYALKHAPDTGPKITATPDQLRSSTNPQPPTSVVLPPGVKISESGAALQGPAPSGTMGPQLTPQVPQPPIQQPMNLGTVGPLPPTPPGPPLTGPPAGGTPPGIISPTPPPRPPSTGIEGLRVGPPGPPLQGPPMNRTPIGTIIPQREVAIADAIFKKGSQAPKIPFISNPERIQRFAQKLELDFIPTKEELAKAREIVKSRELAQKPRP